MNTSGSSTPRPVPPRRVPPWLPALAALGLAAALGGSATVLLHRPEATFGWYAYAPAADQAFQGMTFLTPEAVAGWTGVTVGGVLLAFCAGWLAGRRTARRA